MNTAKPDDRYLLLLQKAREKQFALAKAARKAAEKGKPYEIERPSWTKSPSPQWYLAHPYRSEATEFPNVEILTLPLEVVQEIFFGIGYIPDEIREITASFARAIADPEQSMSVLVEKIRRIGAMVVNSDLMEPTTDSSFGGAEIGPLVLHRFYATGQVLFTFEDKLCHALKKTDLADKTPIAYFRSPYPSCYLEFGKKRDLDLFVFNKKTGSHQLEGVYISERFKNADESQKLNPGMDERFDMLLECGMLSVDRPFREIELMFTGSPLFRGSHIADDAYCSLVLYLDDECGHSLTDVIEKHIEMAVSNLKRNTLT